MGIFQIVNEIKVQYDTLIMAINLKLYHPYITLSCYGVFQIIHCDFENTLQPSK